MTSPRDMNVTVIEEFRSNEGRVGGRFEDASLLLLSTTGGKTGQRRTHPLVYLSDGDRWIVFASKFGAPTNPDWYHNLVANPVVTVEVGAEVIEADAVVVASPEGDQLFARQVEARPQFGVHQSGTTRKFPVIALARRA